MQREGGEEAGGGVRHAGKQKERGEKGGGEGIELATGHSVPCGAESERGGVLDLRQPLGEEGGEPQTTGPREEGDDPVEEHHELFLAQEVGEAQRLREYAISGLVATNRPHLQLDLDIRLQTNILNLLIISILHVHSHSKQTINVLGADELLIARLPVIASAHPHSSQILQHGLCDRIEECDGRELATLHIARSLPAVISIIEFANDGKGNI